MSPLPQFAYTTVSIPHPELGRETIGLALHRDGTAAQNQHVMLGARTHGAAGLSAAARQSVKIGLTFKASANGIASGCHFDSHSSAIQP